MIDKFISVGENIHCTRIYKVGGKFCKEQDGKFGIFYDFEGESRCLPIPDSFVGNSEWEEGKVKHCAVAITQGTKGETDELKQAGIAYLQAQAKKQEACGATYLDINVDEFSTDVDERVGLIEWTVGVVQEASSLPMSIDSSNEAILKAGLAACDKSRARPMLNSVSLERPEAVEIAAEFNAVVVASAAGESGMPCNTAERMQNVKGIMEKLDAVGLMKSDIHVDPLVFPVSVDPTNGKSFLDACTQVRETYGPEIHLVAGLSNISFGLPGRKLLNQVFTLLSVEAGGDGGIVDPMQINLDVLNGLDGASKGVTMARAALLGEDDFAMEYIMAFREGELG